MARYNEILVGRFNRALQKLVGTKGEVPSPQMASEIGTTFDIPLGAEFRYLEGWDLFAATATSGPVAANNAGVRIRATGNILVVVEQVVAVESTAAHARLEVNPTINTDLDSSVVAQNLDARTQRKSAATVSKAVAASAASLNVIQDVFFALNTPYNYIITPGVEIPLLPGSCLQVFETTVNQGLTVSLRWRERVLEDSEKT